MIMRIKPNHHSRYSRNTSFSLVCAQSLHQGILPRKPGNQSTNRKAEDKSGRPGKFRWTGGAAVFFQSRFPTLSWQGHVCATSNILQLVRSSHSLPSPPAVAPSNRRQLPLFVSTTNALRSYPVHPVRGIYTIAPPRIWLL